MNLLAFQQSTAVLCDQGDRSQPMCLDSGRWREVLPYWVTRLHAAWRKALQVELDLAQAKGKGKGPAQGGKGGPTGPNRSSSSHGLYGAAERARLLERLRVNEGSGHKGDSGGLFEVPEKKWTPAPVPTTILERAS